MTDKQKLDAVLMLLNPAAPPQRKEKPIRTNTRSYISSVTDAAALRIRGKKNLC